MKFRIPDTYKIYPSESENTEIIFDENDNTCEIYIKSSDNLEFITLRWNFTQDEERKEPVKILGDAWERSYGELAWKGIEPDRLLPWYFAVSNGSDSIRDFEGRYTECFGVEVQPNAFCSWKYDNRGITLILNVKNGNLPINFENRTVNLCKVIFSEYRNISAFDSLCKFCKEMCPSPLVSDTVVYGSNNWYYTYGNSSADEIISDSKIIAELCKDNSNPPYMVIDDGWTPYRTTPPWTPNEKFGDMKVLAQKMKEIGVIPGIWVRFLNDEKHVLDLPDEAKRLENKMYLDPTHPAVKKHIVDTTNYLVDCGYKLIKHDFSSYDITGQWGRTMSASPCKGKEGYYDRTKTTAQIIKEFYKLIKDTAGDTIILGCNTFGHLCAGLCEANRTGDDTSGRAWAPTRFNGVNTLAFRACQNNAFFVVDADCVGIMGKYDWAINSQWLTLVAQSGTSLFVSCKPSEAKDKTYEDLKREYVYASEQNGSIVPIDWMENNNPCEYYLNGKYVKFNWFEEHGAETF